MKTILSTAATLLALSGTAAFAEGDVEQGEKDFGKCKACHAIVAPDGETIVKGGKTGPNLWGVVGRTAGTQEDFKRYSDEIQQLGEEGFAWTVEEVAAYTPNASEFLEEKLGLDKVRTAMTPQRLKEPADVAAYLAQFGAE
ncbi:cytochrome c family protein [Maritimibacter sp. HL-12]|uniref:c-type cytochrome n=1 Tax=Maritimibacter sp. HL-12 TaxID=1162418 RepID=UPI000A0F389E|nr:c-type cytochrome [Maritimibacter sp. HL-12]SMH34133.1 cytochrome c [Maritimibacter sp. HL-12]